MIYIAAALRDVTSPSDPRSCADGEAKEASVAASKLGFPMRERTKGRPGPGASHSSTAFLPGGMRDGFVLTGLVFETKQIRTTSPGAATVNRDGLRETHYARRVFAGKSQASMVDCGSLAERADGVI